MPVEFKFTEIGGNGIGGNGFSGNGFSGNGFGGNGESYLAETIESLGESFLNDFQ